MSNQNVKCKSQITDYGNLSLIDKGFCYSTINNNPTIGGADCTRWSSSVSIDGGGNFTDTITGLTQTTDYWITAYAINSSGIGYTFPVTTVRTGGISIFPTITVYIKNANGTQQSLYEIGTVNNIVVSGETVQNDETYFIDGYIQQISSPPPPGPQAPTILSWSGFQPTYIISSIGGQTLTFSPVSTDIDSWNLTENAYIDCGIPQYVRSGTTSVSSVFPFLWAMKNSVQNDAYFNPGSSSSLKPAIYFYKDACTPSTGSGKLIQSRGDLTIYVQPTPFAKLLYFGYPSSYGSIQYNPNNVGWYTPSPSTLFDKTVSTDSFPGVNWSCTYKILQYTFPGASGIPLPFSIRFI